MGVAAAWRTQHRLARTQPAVLWLHWASVALATRSLWVYQDMHRTNEEEQLMH